MTGAFLLDTSVISETSKKIKRPEVLSFLEEADEIILPMGALLELQMGIQKLTSTDPHKAVKLAEWYRKLTAGQIEVLQTGTEIIDKWAVLAIDPRLHNLTANAYARGAKPRGGQDLHIAAASLASGIPVATFNVRDFVMINEFYPLLGIYDPATRVWHARAELEASYFMVPQQGPANSNHHVKRELKFLINY